jgi:hypothetical protein
MKNQFSNLFLRPLIVGASISADWASTSPGKRLSSRFTSDIRVIAKGGQPGSKMLPQVRGKDLEDRSVVVGFDLFFWDSSRGMIEESLREFRKMVIETKRLGIPFIVGDVPELLPGFQPGRRELNQMVHRAAVAHDHVYVVPLDDLYQRILQDHVLEIGGKEYSFFDLVPDGLHIGETASEFLAELILETLRSKQVLASSLQDKAN